MKEKLVKFLKTPSVYLSVFIGLKAFQTLEAYRPETHHPAFPIVYPIVLIFSGVAAILALRGNGIARWVLGIYMLSHCFAVPLGLLMPFHQYILKSVFIIFGIYFPYAGYLMIRDARESRREIPNRIGGNVNQVVNFSDPKNLDN
jgi:hypothetical protein